MGEPFENSNIHMETISIKPEHVALGSFILLPTGEAVPAITRVINVELVKGAWRITTQSGALVVPDGDYVQIVA